MKIVRIRIQMISKLGVAIFMVQYESVVYKFLIPSVKISLQFQASTLADEEIDTCMQICMQTDAHMHTNEDMFCCPHTPHPISCSNLHWAV